ncbi:MAG: serine/threonine-protein kinase, partial [Actinomycetota bacterium]
METLNLGIGGLDDIEQIGRGGSSRVYRATQVELDRPVALKVLKAGDDPNVVRRFDRERKAMGRLSLNDGIVPVYSTGITDHGEPYLIMPYYEDGSLQDRMADGPVPWGEAVGYVTEAARTMAAAHEAGVVHLDLKPANILLSSDRQPRIADFGIAKLVNDPSTATNTGAAFTPTYSSPEILLGGAATAASDVYGLAATLWAMLAGRPPFRSQESEDNSLMAVVGRVVHQPIENLRHLAPDEVCAVVEKGMAKDPDERYPTAGAFAQALADATTAASSRESRDVAPMKPADRESTTTTGLLNFEQAVPPRFEPAPAAPRTLVAGGNYARYWMAAGLAAAAILVVVAVSVAAALLTPDATAGGADVSTVSNTEAGDGDESGTDDAPSGPVLSATTPTTSAGGGRCRGHRAARRGGRGGG